VEKGDNVMITKKNLVAIMLAFCISSIMFAVLPIRSQTTSVYDPWADVSGPIVGQPDGVINMRDIAYEITLFNTNGTPLNRTQMNRAIEIGQLMETIVYNNWSNGLLGYWKFDEGNGNVTMDSSGNNNTGILNGTATWVDGKYGKALSFDGVDNYIAVSQSSSLDIANSASITAWIYPIASSPTGVIFSRWYDGTEPDRGIVLQLLPDAYFFAVIDDNNHLNVPFTFESNKWYYLAATWDGSFSRVYVNGMEVGNKTTSGSFTNQNMGLGIGSDINPFQWYFNGTIDEVMMYNRSLSANEIMLHYLLPPL
jgi:hypothetical protein